VNRPLYRWAYLATAVVLGGIFVYASSSKLVDPRPFVTIIWNYRLLPPGAVNAVAIFLPWLELLVGIGLIVGWKRHAAAAWATALLVVFTVALLVNAVRGLDVACGCFSTSSEDTSNAWLLALRDLPMLAAAAWLWLFPPRGADALLAPARRS
jgi:uncharacterized membrane protein YphA (DoxX/SURF4 family)